MWLPSFALIIDDRLDNLVTQKSMGIPYKYVVRYYRQTRSKSASSITITITQPMLISQDEPYVDTSDVEYTTN